MEDHTLSASKILLRNELASGNAQPTAHPEGQGDPSKNNIEYICHGWHDAMRAEHIRTVQGLR